MPSNFIFKSQCWACRWLCEACKAKAMLFSVAVTRAALVVKLIQSMSYCLWVLSAPVVIYAGAKAVALFTCPDHMLNISGCAELNL
mmetsp:Transcript_36126/g.81525  ORF Transcript_36126/g.81525 Transcript_36126/m.81525 type:complete len:86 (+) Transcript_36126:105-362(+)